MMRLALSRLGFLFVALPVLFGPWLFGAWEPWWFWPFAVCVFLAGACLGVMLLLPAPQAETATPRQVIGLRGLCAAAFLPFLVYAAFRAFHGAVFMSAERSFLLFMTPFIVALTVGFGFSPRQREAFFLLLLADLYALGAYGVINHAITGSRFVLWMPGFPQYYTDNRATGSYYCPNHLAGIMELGLAMALGMLLSRGGGWSRRALAGTVAAASLAAVSVSRSRGGGMTVVLILLAGLGFGLSQWPARMRRAIRLTGLAAAAAGVVLFALVNPSYTHRFAAYFGAEKMRGLPFREQCAIVLHQAKYNDRGLMIAGALRAWRETDPLLGIGAGMHQHLWPHFAASNDGDRAARRWPSVINDTFHSYEVHSDWVQLLEEYGVVGLALFLVAAAVWVHALLAGLRAESSALRDRRWHVTGHEGHPYILAALLAGLAMTFHSLGDFNLQMPATVWLLASLLGMGIAAAAAAADE